MIGHRARNVSLSKVAESYIIGNMDEKNKNAVEIYDEIAEDYAKNYDSIDGEEDLIFLNTFLSHVPRGSYLVDIGCGTGFSAEWLVQKGMKVEGCDLSSRMIGIAKKNYPAIRFSIADMRIFKPLQDADAVWAGYSMFHFDQIDFEQTIENIKIWLKSGGILGLVMQEGEGKVDVPEPFLPGRNIYIHLYAEDELKKIVARHGFEIVDFKRRSAQHPNEFTYNKILLVGKLK